jgi:hypothetical protein
MPERTYQVYDEGLPSDPPAAVLSTNQRTVLIAAALGARIQYRWPETLSGKSREVWDRSKAVGLCDGMSQRVHPVDDTPELRRRIAALLAIYG